jgi:glutamine synthetase adenylyltransferase
MALTRARVVAGDASLAADVAEAVAATLLSKRRDAAQVARDACAKCAR